LPDAASIARVAEMIFGDTWATLARLIIARHAFTPFVVSIAKSPGFNVNDVTDDVVYNVSVPLRDMVVTPL
jgi:hypothetical protein